MPPFAIIEIENPPPDSPTQHRVEYNKDMLFTGPYFRAVALVVKYCQENDSVTYEYTNGIQTIMSGTDFLNRCMLLDDDMYNWIGPDYAEIFASSRRKFWLQEQSDGEPVPVLSDSKWGTGWSPDRVDERKD